MRGAERDILREKAATLGRIAGMLESHLDELARLRDSLQTLVGADAEARREEFARVRADAERWQWYLLVQREALGLPDPRPVLERFPIPRLP